MGFCILVTCGEMLVIGRAFWCSVFFSDIVWILSSLYLVVCCSLLLKKFIVYMLGLLINQTLIWYRVDRYSIHWLSEIIICWFNESLVACLDMLNIERALRVLEIIGQCISKLMSDVVAVFFLSLQSGLLMEVSCDCFAM